MNYRDKYELATQACKQQQLKNGHDWTFEQCEEFKAAFIEGLHMKETAARELNSRIRVGSRVTILVPAGRGRDGIEYRQRTGRAVMRGPHGWVLNMGGRYGTPAVATVENIVRVGKKAR